MFKKKSYSMNFLNPYPQNVGPKKNQKTHNKSFQIPQNKFQFITTFSLPNSILLSHFPKTYYTQNPKQQVYLNISLNKYLTYSIPY